MVERGGNNGYEVAALVERRAEVLIVNLADCIFAIRLPGYCVAARRSGAKGFAPLAARRLDSQLHRTLARWSKRSGQPDFNVTARLAIGQYVPLERSLFTWLQGA